MQLFTYATYSIGSSGQSLFALQLSLWGNARMFLVLFLKQILQNWRQSFHQVRLGVTGL